MKKFTLLVLFYSLFHCVVPNHEEKHSSKVDLLVKMLTRKSEHQHNCYKESKICECDAGNGNTICCFKHSNCNKNDKYRSMDGQCNNLRIPSWGRAGTPTIGLLPPAYEDGEHSSRLAADKSELPNARKISVTIFPEKNVPDPNAAYITPIWGQLLAHDFILSQGLTGSTNGISDCCTANRTDENFDHVCMPIEVAKDDPFFSEFNVQCLGMPRHDSTLSNRHCQGPAHQINSNNHFLDAEFVYGSQKEVTNSLRTFSGGLLKERDGGFMPKTNSSFGAGCFPNANICYLAGDSRVNQNLLIATLQTIFLREHNRIAKELSVINPKWDDETLFQESRKITIAQYQHITYNEWLPMIISSKDLSANNIVHSNNKENKNYNQYVNPMVLTEFSTSAFRFMHSSIQSTVNLVNSKGKTIDTINFSDFLFNPGLIEEDQNFGNILNGLLLQKMGKVDRYFSTQLTNVFAHGLSPFGIDLLAVDIQRGRDHGVPLYNTVRNKICGFGKAKTFDDLGIHMSQENIDLLKSVYTHVNDIDLVVGGFLEDYSAPDRVGPTFKCIILEQFYRTKYGDRYFYDNCEQAGSFTQPEQVKEIKKIYLSTILCENTNIIKIKLKSFEISDRFSKTKNPKLQCSKIPKLNLSCWKEK